MKPAKAAEKEVTMGGIMVLFAFGMSLIINLVEKKMDFRNELEIGDKELGNQPATEEAN